MIDALLHNLYTVYVLLIDRSFSDAFIKVFLNIVMCREFNEFKLLIKHIQIFAFLLLKLEKRMEAVRVYEFLRDLTEDTQQNSVAMDVYLQLGKLLQEHGEYEKAIVCFKKLLQIAWYEDNMLMETRAYECLSLQHFYLQQISKANFY